MSAAKQHGKTAEKDRSKQYLVIGIVIALAIAALIIWSKWPSTNPKAEAASIGSETIKVEMLNYFYAQSYNEVLSTAQMFAQAGMSSGYDPNLSPKEQVYDEDTGETYHDYFVTSALDSLRDVVLLKDQATKAGYTLSEAGKASVERELRSIDSQIKKYIITQGGGEDYYLKLMFGETASKPLLRTVINDLVLTKEYAAARSEEFSYDDAALEAYYAENADSLDSFDYHLYFVEATVESGVDEEGNAVEPTEEQTASAMAAAKATADRAASSIRRGAGFAATVQTLVAEEDKATYANEDATLSRDIQLGSSSEVYGTWLKDSARRAGELGVIAQEGKGYYLVQLVAREKREASVGSYEIGAFSFTAETTETIAADGTATKAPTQEQLDAAKLKADELLAKLDAAETKNTAALAALVPDAATAPTAIKIGRNDMGADFAAWAFYPNAVSAGDTRVVESYDSSGKVVGYHVVVIESVGLSLWRETADAALRKADYAAWLAALQPEYEITKLDGIANVGM